MDPKKIGTLFLLLFLFSLVACKKDKGTSGTSCDVDFDQKALFQNLANNLIIKGYESLQLKIDVLKNRVDEFIMEPSSSTLELLQAAYAEAYFRLAASGAV